ncbi:hypothetical protein EXE58_17635 [Nocardioides seonyuensis]|uniref:Uncharacterized protein n=1 Tax=Nocardioides seonyuensis TaxID=2518371 RepID=A0A4P7IIB5_9ACTN|nr:hypothetical protein [Nocardioides seonyuensis]QBX57075.1 hypothetical protein EXE58_17635 [Nocardioides seonyuensis]
MQPPIVDVDPFDLPEWLGTSDVVWSSEGDQHAAHLLAGRLRAGEEELDCDLMSVDEAYPEAVADDATRVRVHHAWRHGQVFIGERSERLTLAVPGSRIDPVVAMDALGRLSRAVGSRPERYSVLLRAGD